MKEYPSIPKDIRSDINVYCFDKLDGQHVRSTWSKKKGFYKFGSKTRLLGEDEKVLGDSIELIRKKYEQDLSKIFTKNKWDMVTCFFEFYGPNSFAGHHDLTESHDVTLFDVCHEREGFLGPAEFMKVFQDVETPKMLYYGKANSFFIDAVRNSELDGMTFEGCCCKALYKKQLIMFKVKSKAWLDKLKNHCKGDEELFEKLA